MALDLDWQFYGNQYEFFYDDGHRLIAVIGGRGTGKSEILTRKAFKDGLAEPGMQAFITAPTYKMLKVATLESWWKACPREYVDWSADEMVCTIKGHGSRYYFRSTSDPDSVRGPNLARGYMDEVCYSPYQAYLNLIGCLRQPGFTQQIALGSTPRGLDWVYNLFNVGDADTLADRKMYRLKTYENPWLSAGYIRDLFNQYQGQYFKQEVEGEFVKFEGLVYPSFDPRIHVKRCEYDERRPVILGIDFGFTNPYGVVAMQDDSYGRIYVFDEIYKVKITDEEMVEFLRAKPYWSNIAAAYCDDAEPDRIIRLKRLGVPATAGKKGKVAARIAKVRDILDPDPFLGTPYLFIDEDCRFLQEEFQKYAYPDAKEDRNANEEPVDKFNHLLSALSYRVNTNWSRRANGAADLAPSPRVMGFQRIR